MTRTVTPGELRARLSGAEELALLDVREQGVHFKGHPFFAVSLPLSHVEMRVADLVPRGSTPIVLLDGGTDGLAEKAEAKLRALGYTDLSILAGGAAGWKAAGGELFSGVNVPSKAFGEFVEHEYATPRIAPSELERLRSEKRKLVILDSRPYDEYHRMNIPGGIDVPGAELAWRVHDLAPDPETLVVVNCAGRTRSIIGCQSLRNAGIPNEVVALKDGTMGWELAGLQCERGSTRVAPAPSEAGRAKARAAAERVARRFRVRFVSFKQLEKLKAEGGRTTYVLDVRTKDEFEGRRLAGSRHAPGGQLVQATDEYVGVRGSRIVLVDPERVRSIMTASWLIQMGWDDVHVLEPAGPDGFAGMPVECGPRPPRHLAFRPWKNVSTGVGERETVLDLSTSLRYRAGHVPGAWWGVRSRLAEATAELAGVERLVLTSEDGILAHYAAPEAAALWPKAQIAVLEGGNAAWFSAGRPIESGMERATTAVDDVAYKAYDHATDYEKHAREYLSWEVALVDQIKRDPSVRFRKL